jgi:hypothetical protein
VPSPESVVPTSPYGASPAAPGCAEPPVTRRNRNHDWDASTTRAGWMNNARQSPAGWSNLSQPSRAQKRSASWRSARRCASDAIRWRSPRTDLQRTPLEAASRAAVPRAGWRRSGNRGRRPDMHGCVPLVPAIGALPLEFRTAPRVQLIRRDAPVLLCAEFLGQFM